MTKITVDKIIVFALFNFLNLFSSCLMGQVTRIIQQPGTNEYGYAISADNLGNSYIGGSGSNFGLVTKLDPSGSVVWSKSINPNIQGSERVDLAYVQVLNDTLFGCGWISDGTTTIGTLYFKQNKNTGNFYWVKSEKTSDSYYSSMKYYEGKFFMISASRTNATIYDGKLVCVASSSGNILWSTDSWGVEYNDFGIDFVDDYYAMTEVQNDKFYISGRSYVSGNNNNMRATLFGFDTDGNIILRKYLLEDESAAGTHRYYGMNISYDGPDSLVIAFFGDQNCSGSCDNYKVGLIKTDLNANIDFAKFYNFTSSPREYVKMLNITNDAYIIFGALNFTATGNSLFALKTNKSGVYQTSTSISFAGTTLPITMGGVNLGGSSDFRNDTHFFTASAYTDNANIRDVVMVQLDQNLNTNNDCINLSIPNVTAVNLVETAFDLITPPKVTTINSGNASTTNNYPFNVQCTDTSDLVYNELILNCDSTQIEVSSISGVNYDITWSNGDLGNSTTVENNSEISLTLFNSTLCCYVFDTVENISVSLVPNINIASNATLCITLDDLFTLESITNCVSCDILWNTGETTSSIEIDSYGIYWVSVTNDCNQTAFDTIEVIEEVPIFPSFTTMIDCFQNLTLNAEPIGSQYDYQWFLEGSLIGNSSEHEINISNPGNYEINLEITNYNGCAYETSEIVTVDDAINLDAFLIPNVITPNGDYINDWVEIPIDIENCVDYRIIFLNRWGNEVFEMTTMKNPFEGKDQKGNLLSEGVYFYKILCPEVNCSEENKCHGFINIFR